ncbi:MAG TPA: alpha/beta fold hydrolase [Methylomirabilota bacterium]|jgi:pimeloyl-ACP methyl ester carboxylesterase|nr:alpha/beta fold hydrolase [Methylomirabilota bacterium]
MANRILPTAAPTRYRRARSADEEYGTTATPDWRGIDWLAHLRRVEVDGTPVNYVDIGEGELEPIVFVHGLGGQWQNWLENIPRAAQERRVIALDLPGSGLSPPPRDGITIPGYGRSVDTVCDKLGLGRVDMVGNSMGGFVAAEVAIQFPERIDQLVLVSAAGIASADVAKAPILTIGRVMSAIATHSLSSDRFLASRPKSRHRVLALVARHPSRLKADLAYEGFLKGAGKPGFQPALRACLNYDFRDRLPEIRQPTLIVWGENDSIIPVRDAHEFERLIPDSRKVVMKETGHVPMAERPNTFNDLMLEFLAETGPASAKEPAGGESQAA